MDNDLNKLDLICGNREKSGIYEDRDYWVATNLEGKFDKRVLKEDNPYWPLSAVEKYGMTPVNNKRLEELSIQLGNALDEAKKGKINDSR